MSNIIELVGRLLLFGITFDGSFKVYVLGLVQVEGVGASFVNWVVLH